MAEPLTQEEIDALLSSLKDGSSGSTTEPEPQAPAPIAVFGELTSETSRRLTAVAESFAKSFERALKPHLELPLKLSVRRLGLSDQPVRPLALLRFSADDRVGGIDFEPKLAMAMADRLMGGQARPAPGRPGALEIAVLAPVFQECANALTHALRLTGQAASSFHDEELEVPTGLCAELELDLHGFTGFMTVILPNFFAGEEVVEEAPVEAATWQVELGRARMSAADLLNLKVGDVIRLDRHADAELTLDCVDSRFRGRPALDGTRLLFTVSAREELN